MVVQASALKKAKSNAAYLVFLDSAIRFEFDAQDELGRNGLDTSRDLAHLRLLAPEQKAKQQQLGMVGESDLTLGNEPLRFRNVSEDVLASEKPAPRGLPGEFGESDLTLGNDRCVFATFRRTFWLQKSPREALKTFV